MEAAPLPTEPTSPTPARSRLWHPNLIVFVSSACVMTLELVAGRIIAPYVGVSLYTWTSVIGVVLAGISLGNYLGGRLADRWASLRVLGVVFLLGGLSCFLVLAVDVLGGHMPGNWHIVLRILALTGALFLLPSMVLGAISPVVVKLAVRSLARTGSTVGGIYAASTVGSIAGTFATGFLLISWFGTHAIVLGVAVILLALGLLLLVSRWPALYAAALVVVLVGAVGAWRWAQPGFPCTRETNYFCIKVRDQERGDGIVRVLILDRLVHSYTSLDDPTQLVYGYEKAYAELTQYRAQRDGHLRALFIGGGGYTFPKYMEAIYPGSDLDVIEIDPGVTQTAYQYLGLRPDTTVVSYNEDARMFLERAPGERYDLVMGDAFNDYSVPYHLTTLEFDERVRAWLEPDGIYMVNIIDGPGGSFLRAYAHTLRQAFAYVYVAPTISSWQTSPRSTFVLLASDTALDTTALAATDGGDGERLLAGQLLPQAELDALLATGRTVTLTDQYAPVDQMLAAVFRDEVPK